MRDTDDIVQIGQHHGEPAVPRLPRSGDQIRHRLVGLHRRDIDPGDENLGRVLLGETDRAGQQLDVAQVDAPTLARRPDQELEVLDRSHRGELLDRLDPQLANGPVGQAVERTRERSEDHPEPVGRTGQDRSGGERVSDGDGLRHQLAQHHLEPRGEHERQGHREAGAAQAEGVQGCFEQPGDRRSGHETQDQRGQGDPQLGAREVERELLEQRADHPGRTVPVPGPLLDPTPVDGDERELAGDEERVQPDEQENGQEAEGSTDGDLPGG